MNDISTSSYLVAIDKLKLAIASLVKRGAAHEAWLMQMRLERYQRIVQSREEAAV